MDTNDHDDYIPTISTQKGVLPEVHIRSMTTDTPDGHTTGKLSPTKEEHISYPSMTTNETSEPDDPAPNSSTSSMDTVVPEPVTNSHSRCAAPTGSTIQTNTTITLPDSGTDSAGVSSLPEKKRKRGKNTVVKPSQGAALDTEGSGKVLSFGVNPEECIRRKPVFVSAIVAIVDFLR